MKLSAHYLKIACVLATIETLLLSTPLIAQRVKNSITFRPVTLSASDGLSFEIFYFHQQVNQQNLQPLSNGSILQIGDRYGIIFTPSKPCYVYIFESDTSGKIVQLFPSGNDAEDLPFQNRNPVQQGKTYYIPSQDSPGRAIKQPMLKQIAVLASLEPDSLIEEQYQFMLSEQKARNDFGTLIAQDELSRTIDMKNLSKITPIIQPGWIKKRPFYSPMIAAQIVQVLRMPFSMRGGTENIEEEKITPEELKGLPAATLLNFFKIRSSKITPESEPILSEYGKALKTELRDAVMVIAAHTDNQGSPDENQQLAQRRAKAVRDFLYRHFQISADRLFIYSYGGSQPLVSNENAEGRRLNNRIELIRIK